MTADKKRRLESTVAHLQKRYGQQAIGRLGARTGRSIPHVSTGFAALDDLLGAGGIPVGHLTELIGVPTSGMTSLCLNIMAQAQSRDVVIYIDTARNFDPDYAARCGVELTRLRLIRPRHVPEAMTIMQDFVVGGGMSLLIFDLPPAFLAATSQIDSLTHTLGRMMAPLHRSTCALVVALSLPVRPPAVLIEHARSTGWVGHASLRLLVQRQRWHFYRRDVQGAEARVEVLRNKFAVASRGLAVDISFHGPITSGPGEGT